MYIISCAGGILFGLACPPVYSQSPGALCGQVGEGRDVAASTPSTKSTKTRAAWGAKRQPSRAEPLPKTLHLCAMMGDLVRQFCSL